MKLCLFLPLLLILSAPSTLAAPVNLLPADYRMKTYPVETPLVLEYKFGPQPENKATLNVVNYPGKRSDLFFFHMHADETTAKRAGEQAVRENGGTFMYLRHSTENREMKARIGKTVYTFDPNRIFTAYGLAGKTVPKPSAGDLIELQKFVHWVTTNINLGRAQRPRAMVTALHNNTDDDTHGEVLSILTEKKLMGIDNRAVNANRGWDIDNFYIATLLSSYEALVAFANPNISLRMEKPRDIGYLSNWMILNGIEYINVETQREDLHSNLAMIQSLQDLFR